MPSIAVRQQMHGLPLQLAHPGLQRLLRRSQDLVLPAIRLAKNDASRQSQLVDHHAVNGALSSCTINTAPLIRVAHMQQPAGDHVLFTFVSYYCRGSRLESRMWDAVKGIGLLGNWFQRHRPRGAVVPFEAPALKMARVCDDERDGLIAILRDFANNGTAYIVPWTSLPLMVSMTDHDIALHGAVAESNASTPEQVRTVVRALALSGALGPDLQTREIASAQKEGAAAADTELILVLHLLDTCGADLQSLVHQPDRGRDDHAKAAITTAAAAMGVTRRVIYHRIAEFTKLLAPVGLPNGSGVSQAGWLRVLLGEIDGFSENLINRSAPAEYSADLSAIADSARQTAGLAGAVFNILDYAVLDIVGTIRRWDTELPVLRQSIDRLSLMLDDWPALMTSVRDALRGGPGDVSRQLHALRGVLPHLPDIEAAVGDTATHSVSEALGVRLSAIRSMLKATRGRW